jgi:Domain of unknown function (DUF1707)
MAAMTGAAPSDKPDHPVPSRLPAGPYVARRELRVSDAERQAVVDELRSHYGAGRIDVTEFEERTHAALASRVRGDLHPLLDDLPDLGGPPAPGPPVRPGPVGAGTPLMADRLFRTHVYVTVVICAFLVAIWAATGGAGGFWPIYPIAALGVPVGIHAAIRKGSSPPPQR